MKNNRTIAYHTLGCKLNFAETSSIGRQLADAGYKKVDFSETPDVFLINTCSVTENANRECRSIVSKALNINPEAIIAITGCFAQLKPDEIASIPGVDIVLGAGEKFNAPQYLNDLMVKGTTLIKSCEIADVNHFQSSWSIGDRTRVFLKVQDGCDYSCSFCTIPLARGASRSNTVENVLNEVNQIVNDGAKEIVLTGINLGDFGNYNATSTRQNSSFFDLMLQLETVNNLDRIRISSIEPNLLDNRIIEHVANSSKFVHHFHIPLQSGSNSVLKKMRRRYLKELYAEKINYIKTLMPDCCIGVDVIVGFPGESETDFLETCEFLKQLDISYLHVFTYSERDNTLAAEMEEIVPIGVRKQRNKILRLLSEKKLRAFYESQVGNELEVLFEADNKTGFMHGFTRNYIKVKTEYNPELINQVVNCKIESVSNECEAVVTVYSNISSI